MSTKNIRSFLAVCDGRKTHRAIAVRGSVVSRRACLDFACFRGDDVVNTYSAILTAVLFRSRHAGNRLPAIEPALNALVEYLVPRATTAATD